jgi:hypothetical protein
MKILQFESNIEKATSDFLNARELKASPARSVADLNANHIQVVFEYNGAMEETRQNRNGFFEYNTHQGTLQIIIATYRDQEADHNERMAKVRFNLLNGNNGLAAQGYRFLDLQPLQSSLSEDMENNADVAQLSYNLKFEVDLTQI